MIFSTFTKASAVATQLAGPPLCLNPLRHFPKTMPPLRSTTKDDLFEYDGTSNGPHDHFHPLPPSDIARHLSPPSPTSLTGHYTSLFALFPSLSLQFRRFASKFTVTDSRDALFSEPDFSSVERPNVPKVNRAFTYCMVGATGVLGAMGAKSTVMNFLTCWSASSEALAMAQVEVDLSGIPEGKSVVIKWRGKPIFIRHRTPEEIEEAEAMDISQLRDPQKDSERTQKPEWIVMLGICTHLGCVPLANSGDYNGWYCPCHGSHYDISGRIRKGPAPSNLEIPEYKFIDDNHIVIG